MRPDGGPTVRIHYLRPPDSLRTYEAELLLDDAACKVTLQVVRPGEDAISMGGRATVEPGGALLWFTYPGRSFEVAAAYDPAGKLLGTYTNFIRPPVVSGRVWQITDLFLDIWQAPEGAAVLLDEAELDHAVEQGWIDERERERVSSEAARVLRAAARGAWPPPEVGRWPLAAATTLRFRRDEPGLYHAALLSRRIIAFGIYMLGGLSLTTLAFALWSRVRGGAPGAAAWFVAIAAEGALLLPLVLAGRLPATRRPRPQEALTERTLFIGTLVSGLAVLGLGRGEIWREALVGIYATFALFLSIFAVCRIRFDRTLPLLSLAGLALSAIAIAVLL